MNIIMKKDTTRAALGLLWAHVLPLILAIIMLVSMNAALNKITELESEAKTAKAAAVAQLEQEFGSTYNSPEYSDESLPKLEKKLILDYIEMVDKMSDEELQQSIIEIEQYNQDILAGRKNLKTPSALENTVIGYIHISNSLSLTEKYDYYQPIVSPKFAEQYAYCASFEDGACVPIGDNTNPHLYYTNHPLFTSYLQLNKRGYNFELVIMGRKISYSMIDYTQDISTKRLPIEEFASNDIPSQIKSSNNNILLLSYIYRKEVPSFGMYSKPYWANACNTCYMEQKEIVNLCRDYTDILEQSQLDTCVHNAFNP